MKNLAKKLTKNHLNALKTEVKRAQSEYLTTNISDRFSIHVVVNDSLEIFTDYNNIQSDNQICIHICSRGAEADWRHFAQEKGDLDSFLRRNMIVLGNESFTERLNLLEQQFSLTFTEYKQKTLDWIMTRFWPTQELINSAIARYQENFSA
ncbi:hypothetical protein [Pelosinus propionicus]|uniref:Uncharacterized protein n=1 Tax=Pelosinus propionicus DSM 13327 TaxID=1123291 RepID=A0A1I4LI64_9FIRM|nr:hypothetical protein [Pelosinus propionicus]SFL90798.1 hypothetical protein SAMN04490355_102510 [Pelosinus propionicus DSM 13327]